MDNVKSVKLGRRWYMTGECECPSCGFSFGFTIPRSVLLFWEGYCSNCSLIPLMADLPEEDEIVIMEMPWDC